MSIFTSYIPIAFSIGATIVAILIGLLIKRKPDEMKIDRTLILLIGAAWIIVGIFIDSIEIRSLGSILLIMGFVAWFMSKAAENEDAENDETT